MQFSSPVSTPSDAPGSIAARKQDHIRICLGDASQFDQRGAGFDRFHFVHQALPEMAPEDVDLSSSILDKPLAAPLIVSSMTGGLSEGAHINRHIAAAVEARGLGMAVGSQRIALVQRETRPSFEIRPHAPTAPLFANFGAVQLNYGFGADEARSAVEMLEADGLFLHLNPLQEVVQPEGDTNFRGLLDKIGKLVTEVPFPVLVKECGCGIAPDTLRALWDRGVAGIDVSGAGGTSWSRVEGQRASTPANRALGETFGNWGIPTTSAVQNGRAAAPDALIIASGGIRSGIDVAKAIALGADLVSIAQPVLAAALDGTDAVVAVLDRFVRELRTTCFLVGARTVADLKQAKLSLP